VGSVGSSRKDHRIMFKTTKKHFRVFKSECAYWIRTFGLIDWEVYYFHENNSDNDRAWLTQKVVGRVCGLFLGKNWGSIKPTKRLVRLAAFHEVCELLLTRLDIEAKFRFALEDNVNEARHAVIRVLEKVIWEAYSKEK
jgi:hypothetical protein